MSGKKSTEQKQRRSGEVKKGASADHGPISKTVPTTPKKARPRLPTGWTMTKFVPHRAARIWSPTPPLPAYRPVKELSWPIQSIAVLEGRFGPNLDRPVQGAFPLMDLPKFIRQKIFAFIVVSKEPITPYQNGVKSLKGGYNSDKCSLVSALLINRTLYLEAISELYGTNQFAFTFPTNLLLFLSTIGPRNAQLLRHLVIRFSLLPPNGTLSTEPESRDATRELRRERDAREAIQMEMEMMTLNNGPWAIPQMRNLAHWLFLSRISPFPDPEPEKYTGRVFVGSPNAFAQGKASAGGCQGDFEDPSAPFFWLKPGPRKDVQANHRAAVAVFTRMWADTLGVLLPDSALAQGTKSQDIKKSPTSKTRPSPVTSHSMPSTHQNSKPAPVLASPRLPLPIPQPALPSSQTPSQLNPPHANSAAQPATRCQPSNGPVKSKVFLPLEYISGEIPPPCWSISEIEGGFKRQPLRPTSSTLSAKKTENASDKKWQKSDLGLQSKRLSRICSGLKTLRVIFEHNGRCCRGCCNSTDILSRASSTVPVDVIAKYLPQLHPTHQPKEHVENELRPPRLRSQTSRSALRHASSQNALRKPADMPRAIEGQEDVPPVPRIPQQLNRPLLRHAPSQPILRKVSDPSAGHDMSSQTIYQRRGHFKEGASLQPKSPVHEREQGLNRPKLRPMPSQPIMRDRAVSNAWNLTPRTPIYGDGPSAPQSPARLLGPLSPPFQARHHRRNAERSQPSEKVTSPPKPEPQPRRPTMNHQLGSPERRLPERLEKFPELAQVSPVRHNRETSARPRMASAVSAPVVPIHDQIGPRRASDGSGVKASGAQESGVPRKFAIAPIYGAGPNLSDVHSSGALSDTPTGKSLSEVLAQLRELNVEILMTGMHRRSSY